MKYAVTLASFWDIEPVEQTLKKLSTLGYDSVEMYGEPGMADADKLLELSRSYDMNICGVTGVWGSAGKDVWKRKL